MEGLFAWASHQMDTLAVTLGEVHLDEVAHEVLKGAGEAASDKGLTLRAGCAGVRVRAQRDMLATVLRNLVTNAVKFTLPGGAVTVAARRHGDMVEISVSDTGVGMPPGVVADLFRLDRSRDDERHGGRARQRSGPTPLPRPGRTAGRGTGGPERHRPGHDLSFHAPHRVRGLADALR